MCCWIQNILLRIFASCSLGVLAYNFLFEVELPSWTFMSPNILVMFLESSDSDVKSHGHSCAAGNAPGWEWESTENFKTNYFYDFSVLVSVQVQGHTGNILFRESVSKLSLKVQMVNILGFADHIWPLSERPNVFSYTSLKNVKSILVPRLYENRARAIVC